MRGEKAEAAEAEAEAAGSSPRAWGKGAQGRQLHHAVRIIPTCVGKRKITSETSRSASDHPHVRGEKLAGPVPIRKPVGSSPRAWGKVLVPAAYRNIRRIIPTCVGKRRSVSANTLALTDHPHVRGEKTMMRIKHMFQSGSSPRAWGKGVGTGRDDGIARIIPTCVGKRSVNWRTEGCATDHPHVRGEKDCLTAFSRALAGSSPRAWGKEFLPQFNTELKRIIPTCVGKRFGRGRRSAWTTDHPHVRGEKQLWVTHIGHPGGSSPRAWGKVLFLVGDLGGHRIIPTCVGKSAGRVGAGC